MVKCVGYFGLGVRA